MLKLRLAKLSGAQQDVRATRTLTAVLTATVCTLNERFEVKSCFGGSQMSVVQDLFHRSFRSL